MTPLSIVIVVLAALVVGVVIGARVGIEIVTRGIALGWSEELKYRVTANLVAYRLRQEERQKNAEKVN